MKRPIRGPTEAEFLEVAKECAVDRYVRRRPLGGRIAALDHLHYQLVDDAKLYESDDLQDQRDAVAHALLSVMDYLTMQGFAPATLAPVARSVAALAERENNSIDQMFAQRARAGRPKSTLAQHQRTGILAALAEAWLQINADDDRLQSAKLAEAARKMRGRWFGRTSRAQLETAREMVSQEANDHPAVENYKLNYGWYVHFAELFGNEDAFHFMVRFLNDTKVRFGLGEGGIWKTPHVTPTEGR